MDLPITGPAYVSPSQTTNYQRCVNMFLIDPGPEGSGKGTLLPTPGHKLIVDLGTSICRGIYTVGIWIYVLAGNTFVRFNLNAITRTASNVQVLGTIATTTGNISFSNNATQIILVDGSTSGYIYDTVANTFTAISDTDFQGGLTVTYLDGYFIYNKPNSQLMYASALQDGTMWDGLDVASAEMHPDNLVGLNTTKGEIWAFGTDTVEVWYDAANPTGFPLAVRVGSEMDVGCGATSSIVRVDEILMWLDSRGFVVQSDNSPFIRNNSSGYDLKIVSTDAINNEIDNYVSTTDAIGMSFNDRGHIIYQITFPNAGKTWAFDHSTSLWHEKTYYNSFTGKEEYSLSQYCVKYQNLNVVGGIRDGKIYIMDHTYYDDNSAPIHRLRTSAPQTNEFKLIGINDLEIKCDTGYAPEGANPKIILRYSNDNGRTYSDHLRRDLGKVGEYGKRITWNRLGTSYNWLFEFSIWDPVQFAIVYASINADSEK